jgi:hypothetical protein
MTIRTLSAVHSGLYYALYTWKNLRRIECHFGVSGFYCEGRKGIGSSDL